MATQKLNLGSVIGPKGEEGPQGPQGPQGDRGADGASIVIKGSVTNATDLPDFATTAVGSAYVVENTGDDQYDLYIRGEDTAEGETAATWTIVADWQGVKGDQGPQGPAGAQGIQGPKGDTGAQGEKGDTGAQGPKGDQGEKGDTGPQGDLLVPTFSIDENGHLWVEYEDGTSAPVE